MPNAPLRRHWLSFCWTSIVCSCFPVLLLSADNRLLNIDLFPCSILAHVNNIYLRKQYIFGRRHVVRPDGFLNPVVVVTEGVAVPSSRRALCCLHLCLAISLASYFGVISDLYELSCSSSTTIAPSFLKGANTAERAPTATSTEPSRIFSHWSNFSPMDNLLWITATLSPIWIWIC